MMPFRAWASISLLTCRANGYSAIDKTKWLVGVQLQQGRLSDMNAGDMQQCWGWLQSKWVFHEDACGSLLLLFCNDCMQDAICRDQLGTSFSIPLRRYSVWALMNRLVRCWHIFA